MRKAVTIRLEPEIIEQAKTCARSENRLLTNFIETAVKQRIVEFESRKSALSAPEALGPVNYLNQSGRP